MDSQQNGSEDRITSQFWICAACGGSLLPCGYGVIDPNGRAFDVKCESCKSRSVVRTGKYALAPRESSVPDFFMENTVHKLA